MSGSNTHEVWVSDSPIECDQLIFETTLSSPQMPVVATLSAGHSLDVALRIEGDTRMIAAMLSDAVVGTITEKRYLASLIRCLQQGGEFSAGVISVEASIVRVEVHPR